MHNLCISTLIRMDDKTFVIVQSTNKVTKLQLYYSWIIKFKFCNICKLRHCAYCHIPWSVTENHIKTEGTSWDILLHSEMRRLLCFGNLQHLNHESQWRVLGVSKPLWTQTHLTANNGKKLHESMAKNHSFRGTKVSVPLIVNLHSSCHIGKSLLSEGFVNFLWTALRSSTLLIKSRFYFNFSVKFCCVCSSYAE